MENRRAPPRAPPVRRGPLPIEVSPTLSSLPATALPGAEEETRQPTGLYLLFGAEAFERFSYYGMRAILVLFLVKKLGFERADALALYGVYTGLVYLTPLLGGFLADRILGARKAVIIGGITMALGEIGLAFPSLLYPSLALLILGNGFFKPNISTIVGGLYREGDPRRDGGFTIFYMGINLGAFFSPLVCGTLGEKFGWHYGFIAAGLGMIVGQIIFNLGQHHYGTAGYPPDMKAQGVEPGTPLRAKDWMDIVLYIAGVFGLVAVAWLAWANVAALKALMASPLPLAVLLAIAGTTLLGLGSLGSTSHQQVRTEEDGEATFGGFTTAEWQRILVIVILAFFVTFFWMGFEQAGGTMNLFADQQTDRHLGAFEIPASWFQSVNPLLIVALAPLFSMMWYRLDTSRYAISTPMKMAFGMIILGLGFVVMYAGASRAQGGVLVGPQWLLAVYTLHTIGELFLSPVGLSMVTKLAPARLTAIMMGFWFLSSAAANYLAGTLESMLHAYQVNMWAFLIASSMGAGVVLILITPLLKKGMHGRA